MYFFDVQINAMVISHPSMGLYQGGFGGGPPEAMAATVTVPTLLQPAGDDNVRLLFLIKSKTTKTFL